jgi:hypothetical protein
MRHRGTSPGPSVTFPPKSGWAPTLIVLLTMSGTAFAHHGFGSFDLTKDIEFTGTVARVEFINPHAYLHVDVQTKEGESATYHCEMRGATVLRRSGWSPDLFPAGTRVTVQGAPDRLNRWRCYVNTIVLPDGTRLDRYTQRTTGAPNETNRPMRRRPDGTPDLAGDWAPEQQIMSDPRGLHGVLVPLSVATGLRPGAIPGDRIVLLGSRDSSWWSIGVGVYRVIVGAARLEQSPWHTATVELTPLGRAAIRPTPPGCEFTSILWDWLWEMTVNRVSYGPDAVVLQYGQHGVTRTIHMSVDQHPDDLKPSRTGHSIGRWEGDVLVVDTVGFLPGVLGQVVPHTGKLHVVERFALDSATNALRRDYVADDPDYFARPYRGSDTMFRSRVPYAVDPCEERAAAGGEAR